MGDCVKKGVNEMIIVHNENFKITENDGKILIETFKTGFPIKEFDGILHSNPRIKLTNFAVLKNVLENITEKPIEIGYWMPNVVVEISKDKMTAFLIINEGVEYILGNVEPLKEQISSELEKQGVTHGVIEFNIDSYTPGKPYVIAKGSLPVKGEDAVVSYLPKPERKPVIKEDGKADYYDMNFISEISEGTWLGEKIPAGPGTPGMTVVGEAIPSQQGREAVLKYDKKSAYVVEEVGKIVLRSKIAGVLEHGKSGIGVNKHLPIHGDVGVETGNLNFDGSISIKGTVGTGFTVVATGDISIEGAEGVSGAKHIKSVEGDVYIRGGIFGLGQTIVEAGGNIYVKHVNEANIHAENEIHIGSYAIGANLTAHSILLDERKGKIIGGCAVAKTSIVAAISGNHLERKTDLILDVVNKEDIYADMQLKAAAMKELQEGIEGLKERLDKLTPFLERLSKEQIAVYEQTKQSINLRTAEIQHFDREIKILMEAHRAAGKEFINITKEAHPGTYIKIGKKSTIISKLTNGKFVLEFGELNV